MDGRQGPPGPRPARCAVEGCRIQGAAPAGSILHLHKQFTTESSPICTFAQGLVVAGGPLSPLDCVAPNGTTKTPDHLDYTMVVPSTNHYEWHVTPSTRPFVFQKTTPGGYSDTAYGTPQKFDAADADVPGGDRGIDDPQGLVGSDENDYAASRRFSVAPDEAGNKIVVDLNWDVPAQDYDLRLYHVKPDGSLEPAGFGTGPTGGSDGGSGEANGVPEQIEVDRAEAGDYVAKVIYYVTGAPETGQGNDWHMTVTRYQGLPDKVESGRETWTMTCETSDGHVLEQKDIYVERGQAVTADFGCGGAVPQSGSGAVLGEKDVATINAPSSKKKNASKRAACLKKASKAGSKAKRKAAVKRCNKRYPAKAKKHAQRHTRKHAKRHARKHTTKRK